MGLALHFYKFAESYTVLFAWIVIPLTYLVVYLWVKNNSLQIELPEMQLNQDELSKTDEGKENSATATVQSVENNSSEAESKREAA